MHIEKDRHRVGHNVIGTVLYAMAGRNAADARRMRRDQWRKEHPSFSDAVETNDMDSRIARGKRWLRWTLIIIWIPPAIQILFAPLHQSPVDRLASALVQLLVGSVVFGGGAFLLGWITGESESDAQDGARESIDDSNQNRETTGAAQPRAGSAFHVGARSVATQIVPVGSKAVGAVSGPDDESLWEQVLEEFGSAARRQGVWAKALAQAHGDESKAMATYLRERFEQLADDRDALGNTDELGRQADVLQEAKAQQVARLVASIKTDPYGSVGKRARLIEALGGQIEWKIGGSFRHACLVKLAAHERRFAQAEDFKRWVDLELIPSLLIDPSSDRTTL